MASEFPTGTVTLVFTDIEGSSVLWERHRAAFQTVLDKHNSLMRESVAPWNGLEVKSEGDGFMLVFAIASDAVQFAVNVQRALLEHTWPLNIDKIRVRIGIHTGEVLLRRHPSGALDYFGPVVNRAARIMSAGHGEQIIVSNATYALVQSELPAEITFHDLGVHRLRGVGEEHIWQVDHPNLSHDFPPLKTLKPEKHNLPLLPTPFIGREEEIATWCALLRHPTTRLLTLTGFGGIGKTRIALQSAELCSDDFEDGVWFIELAESRTGEGMIQRIAHHLRLHLQPQLSVKEQLLTFLRERQPLLVLDNTEQIPEAADVVNELLNAALRIKCLVVSRHALELQSEHLVEVTPLTSFDAETLFVERARARKADFALTSDNTNDIAKLCRRLEGVPLAIELAASRIIGMTAREILNRLTERFRILQHERALDLPPRQRALRGTIDWSYELLADDNKALFAQLSVFAGGFTLEAAEAICDVPDVFEGVMELRQHSLLRAETYAPTQQMRYLMLESVREYATEKLNRFEDNGMWVRRRHAEYFLQFVEQRVALMKTRDEVRALDELSIDLDNLRMTMSWTQASVVSRAKQQNGVEAEWCARLSLALYQLLYRRGLWAEAQRYLQTGWEATKHVEGDARGLQGAIGHYLASIAQDMGNLVEAWTLAETSLALYRRLNDQKGIADSLNLLGLIAIDEDNTDAAQQFLEDALKLITDNDHASRGIVLHNLARLASRRGNIEEAQQLYKEALSHRRVAGDVRGEAETLSNLGVLAQKVGNHAEARRLYRESLALRHDLRDRFGIAIVLNNLGEIAELDGALETAITLFVHSKRIFHTLQAAYEREPNASLENLERQLGAKRFSKLRRKAEILTLEEVMEQEIGGKRKGRRARKSGKGGKEDEG